MSVKLLYFSVHVLSPYGGFMNLKLWASCGAIIASATFAQDASYTQTAPVQGVQMVPVQTAQGIQMMPVAQPVQGTQMQAAQPTQMQTADQPQAAQMVPVQTAQGVQMMPVGYMPMDLLVKPAGGFIVLGLMMALMNKVLPKKA